VARVVAKGDEVVDEVEVEDEEGEGDLEG